MRSWERVERVERRFPSWLLVREERPGTGTVDREAELVDLQRQAWVEGFILVPREAALIDDPAVLNTVVTERFREASKLLDATP